MCGTLRPISNANPIVSIKHTDNAAFDVQPQGYGRPVDRRKKSNDRQFGGFPSERLQCGGIVTGRRTEWHSDHGSSRRQPERMSGLRRNGIPYRNFT
jgi:hypothetical protein